MLDAMFAEILKPQREVYVTREWMHNKAKEGNRFRPATVQEQQNCFLYYIISNTDTRPYVMEAVK